MKIELKKLQVYPRMSEETTAFSAEVYINGTHVGSARNDGKGGETELQFYHAQVSKEALLCDAAFAWAAALPPKDFGGKRTWKMDLNSYIEDLMYEQLQMKKNMTKWKKGYAWGVPKAKSYTYRALKPRGMTFEKMIAIDAVAARRIIQSNIATIKRDLNKDRGEVLLNADYLRSLGFNV
jgi:hypothetical protein